MNNNIEIYRNEFCNKLCDDYDDFKKNYVESYLDGETIGWPSEIYELIKRDSSSRIKISEDITDPITFLEVINQYNIGRCHQCSIHLAFLIDKLLIEQEQSNYKVSVVEGKNNYYKGTLGSAEGGHWWIQIYDISIKKTYIIDTSLHIVTIANSLGYVPTYIRDVAQMKQEHSFDNWYNGISLSPRIK